MPVQWKLNLASVDELRNHLSQCDSDFTPALSSRVQLDEYARKLFQNAICHEAWKDGNLIGLVAMYCVQDGNRPAFISSVSVTSEHRGHGIAQRLVQLSIASAQEYGSSSVELEVNCKSEKAVALYSKLGFTSFGENDDVVRMVWTDEGVEE